MILRWVKDRKLANFYCDSWFDHIPVVKWGCRYYVVDITWSALVDGTVACVKLERLGKKVCATKQQMELRRQQEIQAGKHG